MIQRGQFLTKQSRFGAEHFMCFPDPSNTEVSFISHNIPGDLEPVELGHLLYSFILVIIIDKGYNRLFLTAPVNHIF